MRWRPRIPWLAGVLMLALGSSAWGAGPTPKSGGVLNAMHREDPPSLSIHEEATISTNWPVMPCYSNLVLFNPLRGQESPATIVGELAETWAWRDDGKTLAFALRKGVRWHDGQPLTSKDVKYTFDLVRGAAGSSGLRLDPRKNWYAQIAAIDAPDPYSVVFHLRRPQPSLLMLFASDYSPVYPAHVPAADLRTRCVGTGPFKLKEYRPGELIEFVRNPDYFIKGRPYLDGIRFIIIKERGTRIAALQAGRVDVTMPSEGTKPAADQLKRAVPGMVVYETSQNVNDNILMNFKKPPFTDARVRRAVSLAIDRRGYIQAVRQGGAVVGASMLPQPWGNWGLSPDGLATLPGSGDPLKQKADARQLLAEAGFGPGRPLRLVVSTRAIANYLDQATFVIDQIKQVGIEATLEQVESAVWYAKLTRGEYEMGSNQTGIGVDDPDANFYENYVCGSPRNYPQYCNPDVDKMIEEQSQTLDPVKRRRLVAEIQKRLELDGARPILGWTTDYYAMWPHVKNLVPHHSIFSYARFQDVWLDR
ncbi:MAG TPA: ABC transporter substrate-binding protein [bacterium]|nr:ABC transporter substrate-binding protein [bacterium]